MDVKRIVRRGIMAFGDELKDITYTRVVESDEFDPVTGANTVETEYQVKGLARTLNAFEAGNKYTVEDYSILVSVLDIDFEPTTADRLSFDGHDYSILDPKDGGLGASWLLIARRT